MRHGRSSALRAFVLLPLLGGAACTLLNSLDGYSRAAPSPREDASDVEASTCTLALPPEPPKDAGGRNIGPLYFAVNRFVFSIQSSAKDSGLPPEKSGYDQDGRCTCPVDEGSCLQPLPVTRTVCDRPNGIDNQMADFFEEVLNSAALATGLAKALDPNAYVTSGLTSLMFKLEDWDGTANDSTVTLVVNGSGPLEFSSLPRDGGAVGKAPYLTASAFIPAFDGNDRWSVVVPPAPTTSAAYVRDGILVTRERIKLALGPTEFPIDYGALTAKISNTDGRYTLSDGILTGRVSALSFLTSLQGIDDPTAPGSHLCEGKSAVYAALKTTLCALVDLAETPFGAPATLPCASISAGIGFTATQIEAGSRYTPPKGSELPCGANYTPTGCQP